MSRYYGYAQCSLCSATDPAPETRTWVFDSMYLCAAHFERESGMAPVRPSQERITQPMAIALPPAEDFDIDD